MKRRLLLVSNSTLHGGEYLQHCQQQISDFFGTDVKKVLFVPYALHDRDAYAKTARDKFKTLGYEVDSIHKASDPVDAVRKAEAIFIGGGNTFRLLKSLYDNKVVMEIRKRVLEDGVPYMGSSAGTNVATISINTTNDMPIVYPPALALMSPPSASTPPTTCPSSTLPPSPPSASFPSTSIRTSWTPTPTAATWEKQESKELSSSMKNPIRRVS
ncbi:hypothetical protein LDENG_00181850 [Lucifuga dentata]|nr:hypothetical protein LDENG_00181850 [Lucifuga dentata]